MTREEAIKVLKNEIKCVNSECDIENNCGKCPYSMPTKEPIIQAYNMAISALKQQPCEDAVSRQDVLDLVAGEISHETYEGIYKLPSVTQKSGEWKPFDLTYGRSIYYCTACEHSTEVPTSMDEPLYKYCPNCGAKMENEQNE